MQKRDSCEFLYPNDISVHFTVKPGNQRSILDDLNKLSTEEHHTLSLTNFNQTMYLNQRQIPQTGFKGRKKHQLP